MPGVSFAEGQIAGLEQTEYYYSPQSSFCNGTHICEAEVDPMTGGQIDALLKEAYAAPRDIVERGKEILDRASK